MRVLLPFIFLILFSCVGSSGGGGQGALYENTSEQYEDPNEAIPDCESEINQYKRKLLSLYDLANDLTVEINDLNSRIDELTPEEYDNQMYYIQSQMDDVEAKLNELKDEF
jgi:chromosome segregation ATPase